MQLTKRLTYVVWYKENTLITSLPTDLRANLVRISTTSPTGAGTISNNFGGGPQSLTTLTTGVVYLFDAKTANLPVTVDNGEPGTVSVPAPMNLGIRGTLGKGEDYSAQMVYNYRFSAGNVVYTTGSGTLQLNVNGGEYLSLEDFNTAAHDVELPFSFGYKLTHSAGTPVDGQFTLTFYA